MKKRLCLIILSITFLLPVSANAESIESFDVHFDINKDGSMNIIENILYDYGINDRHGIFREIPRSAKVENLWRIQTYTVNSVGRDGSEEPYTTSTIGDTYTIKIGDPDKTIADKHLYTISYSVKNGLATFEDHDELYWNVTGNDWEIPIMKATAVITPPEGIQVNQAKCYTGIGGSSAQDCEISADNKKFSVKSGLAAHEGLTIVAGFPANTFPKNILTDHSAAGISGTTATILGIIYTGFAVFMNIIAPIFVWRWYTKKRDKVRLGPIHVNFDIPSDNEHNRLSPAIAGTTDSATMDQNDVIATIFDLAIRKHIRITQETEKKNYILFEKDDKKYYFEKLPDAGNTLEAHEKILMDRLFRDADKVELGTLNSDFYKTYESMSQSVYSQLEQKGLYNGNPNTRKILFIVGAVFSFVLGGAVLALVLTILSRKPTTRTPLGDQTDWRIDGLKEFLSKMDRNYTWQANQLAIVEQMIPYAMAFGYIEKFMEQLKVIKPDYQPAWYHGSTPFYDISPSLMSSMNSGLTVNAPSSSSGFSGGSSGGGGGGGGGGSW